MSLIFQKLATFKTKTGVFCSIVGRPGQTRFSGQHHACLLGNKDSQFGIGALISPSWLLTHAEAVPTGKSRYANCKGQIRNWTYPGVHYLTLEDSDEELALIQVTEMFDLSTEVFPVSLPFHINIEDVKMLRLHWNWEPVYHEHEKDVVTHQWQQVDIEKLGLNEESQEEDNSAQENNPDGTVEQDEPEQIGSNSLEFSPEEAVCHWVNKEFSAGNPSQLDNNHCQIVPHSENICEPGFAVPVVGSLSDDFGVLVGIVKYLNACTEPGNSPAHGLIPITDFLHMIEYVVYGELVYTG